MQRYNPKDIEPKWQATWDELGTYKADLHSDKPTYLALSMFNYPSGAGIHIGHAMNYTISDVKARFKRQQGYESYHPVGWDAFGLPAENYAIKAGVSPQASMAKIIPDYHKQYKAMGWSNDWSKEIATHEPEYYRWTQWIFAQMYKQGLAYQDLRMQWWCESDKTVLSNEQVIDGKCWRHDGPDDPLVAKKEVKQWFFKITDYADELLEAIEDLDWTEGVKTAQYNWIGRSSGAEIQFAIDQDFTGKDFVFLHGFTGTPQQDFWQWLKHEIESKGGTVYLPQLPNSASPSVMQQARYVLENYNFTATTTLVGHSLGGAVAAKIIEQLPSSIEGLLLVSPALFNDWKDNKERPILDAACDWIFDFDLIKSKIHNITILYDRNDHIITLEKAKLAAELLVADFIETDAQQTHFNAPEEPAILAALTHKIPVFTTRADTIFSAAFVVLAPEHPLTLQIATNDQKQAVSDYQKQAALKSDLERQAVGDKEKTGVFTGAYAVNPANDERIPVWTSDFVLAGYGTGAVFGDIHDERDFVFMHKFDIPGRVTVVPDDSTEAEKVKNKEYAYTAEGVLIDSGDFTGMRSEQARDKIIIWLNEQGAATEKVNYKMRDWSISRQRYWGAPIPIINCKKCGLVLVEDDQLPVVLPELTDFAPSGDGRSALARATDWLNVDCPKCGGSAERETDTLDTYICSSWYMLRYLDPHNNQAIFDSAIVNKWMPVNFYNGGDHATAHLLYARFITRFLHKIGLVDNPEPFKTMLFNGKVTAHDGSPFSKSKGNGIDPLEIINSGYGADALRTYLMFAAPLEISARWDPQGVPATHRFISRVWNVVQEYLEAADADIDAALAANIRRTSHVMIKKVTADLEASKYNTAIAAMMADVNDLYRYKVKHLSKSTVWQEALESVVICVAPFAPHAAEELWHQLGHQDSVNKDHWPQWDAAALIEDTMTIAVQINGKLRAQIKIAADATEDQVVNAAKANDHVKTFMKGKQPLKIIYVAGKLVSLVI